jgi:hypothetical protein
MQKRKERRGTQRNQSTDQGKAEERTGMRNGKNGEPLRIPKRFSIFLAMRLTTFCEKEQDAASNFVRVSSNSY